VIGRIRQGTMLLGALAIAVATNGCILQPDAVEVRSAPRPAPSATVNHERRDSVSLMVENASSSGSSDVVVSQPFECRDQAPAWVQDVEKRRSASKYEQLINGSAFLAFGGIGAAALAADCTTTPDASKANPNPVSSPCTAKDKGTQYALGGSLLGLGALFGAAFVYNVIKARDITDTQPVAAPPAEWKKCGTKPIASTSVRLVFADQQAVDGKMDSEGRAHFDVSTVRWSDATCMSNTARFTESDGATYRSVGIDSLPRCAELARLERAKSEMADQRRSAESWREQHPGRACMNDCVGVGQQCVRARLPGCQAMLNDCTAGCQGLSAR